MTDTYRTLARKFFDLVADEEDGELEYLIAKRAVGMKWCDGYIECTPDLKIVGHVRPEAWEPGTGEQLGDKDDNEWLAFEWTFREWLEYGDEADVAPRIAAVRALLDKVEQQLSQSAG